MKLAAVLIVLGVLVAALAIGHELKESYEMSVALHALQLKAANAVE